MAEETGQEKTEEATPKKQNEAAKKGQVPRSRELTTVAMLLGAASCLLIMGSYITETISSILIGGWNIPRAYAFDTIMMTETLYDQVQSGLVMLVPLFAVMVVIAILSSVAIGGIGVSLEALQFKAEKMSPLKGLKRMFGVQALMEMVKAIAKASLVGSVLVFLLWHNADWIVGLANRGVAGGLGVAIDFVLWSFIFLAASLLVVVSIDVPFQMWNHAKQLKMTLQEVKDENKDTMGNPEMKNRLRQLQMEASNQRMMSAVPDADVIVTNPTHFAVALRYDQDNMGSPIVVAKGADLIAMYIRRIGDAHNITRIEAPPLARSLFYSTEIDQPIPRGLYMAVAQLLAYVYQLKQNPRNRKKMVLPDFPIPEEHKRD
ncbi:MAG: flagellar biosynthesis protein FlhB [Gammaproteobacteria bacterium]|nr:flagellar biosynthesis protein FlhB [Gammaproteobacteria bacterium]PCH62712.1 MAG: flagellar biosynthesis protein FlhB [Gammaproteobacteria bacterium]PCH64157.1 MAG: flagellar biosynthesis protein FlhB [Gammaproteobacteria bacterium]